MSSLTEAHAASPAAAEDEEMPRTAQLYVQRAVAELEVPESPAVEMPASPGTDTVDTGSVTAAASGVNVSGSAKPSEGIGDWLIAQATSAFQSLVGGVSGDASQTGSGAAGVLGGAASALFSGIGGLASQLASFLTGGFRELLSGHGGILKTALRGVKSVLRDLLHRAASSVKGLQDQIKSRLLSMLQAAQGNPLETVKQMIQQKIDSVISGIASAISDKVAAVAASVTAALSGLEALVARIGPQLQAFVESAEASILRVITTVKGMVEGFLDKAMSAVQRLPGAVRSLVESLVAGLRAAVERFTAAVTAAAERIATNIRGIIGRITQVVAQVAEAAKSALVRIVTFVTENANRIIHTVVETAVRIGRTIFSTVSDAVSKAIKFLIFGLPGLLLDYAIEKATPYVTQWILGALNIDLSKVPFKPNDPSAISGKAAQMAQQSAASTTGAFAAGLLNPQGDHLAQGLYLTGSMTQANGGVSGSLSTQATLDLVTNYVTNQLDLYFSLGASVGLGASTSGGPGLEGGVTESWGTIQTFGTDAAGKPKDITNFEGRFFNVGGSVGGGGPVEGVPVAASTGGGIYMSGATSTPGTPGTTTPGQCVPVPGTPGQTTPGQTTPGQTTPGQTTPGQTTPGQTTPGQTTPGQTIPAHTLVTTSVVPFVNQSPKPPGDPAAGVVSAKDAIKGDHDANPDDHYTVDVTGHSSNRWRAVGPDEGQRLSNNQDLSEQRAAAVAGQVDRIVEGLPVDGSASHHGEGVKQAHGDRTTNNPDDRRADITVTVGQTTAPGTTTPGTTTPGTTTPGTTTPGTTTPGTDTPGTTTPGTPGSVVCTPGTTTPGTPGESTGMNTGGSGPLGVWGPQTSGGTPLVGWDSTLNVGLSTSSKEANAGAGVSVGNSYSWPILPEPLHLSDTTMTLLRVIIGLYKLKMDVTSLSPLGFLRDAVGILAPVLNAQTDKAVDAIVNTVIPIPDDELA